MRAAEVTCRPVEAIPATTATARGVSAPVLSGMAGELTQSLVLDPPTGHASADYRAEIVKACLAYLRRCSDVEAERQSRPVETDRS